MVREVALRRRTTAGAVLVMLLAIPSATLPQQSERAVRIGFLGTASAENNAARLAALRKGLHELGYADSRVTIEARHASGKIDQLPRLAAELVRLNVDVLVAESTPAAVSAKQATRTIPIVMTNSGDPVGIGLITSLSRPGGNVTGLSDFSSDLVTKRLELLKSVVPAATRIGVVLNPANPTNALELRTLRTTAEKVGITILPVEVRGMEDIDQAFAALVSNRADAVLFAGDAMWGTHRKQIVALAAATKLPALYPGRGPVTAGGLMSLGANFTDLARRSAHYVDRILKGAKPAELPIEQPMTFDFAINLRTAKALGVSVPPSVRLRADHVIE